MTQDNKIEFKIIAHNSDDYHQAVKVRNKILREPLGLVFTDEQLQEEKNHIHVAGFCDGTICVTAILVPENKKLKMRQVAVSSSHQNIGLGSKLIQFCDEYAIAHGFNEIYCHARQTAVPFYQRNGYNIEGDKFLEIGIPHYKMRKLL